VEATRDLVAAGGPSPTIDAIAAAAEVSRRTIYVHFPTLDQLLLDATLGALSDAYVDTALAEADAGMGAHGPDVHARLDALIDAIIGQAPQTLPLGRRVIQLTVARPDDTAAGAEDQPTHPRRGQRRTTWLEAAVAPIRDRLTDEQHERLVSGLSLLIGFESMVVLRDVRGLGTAAETATTKWAAHALVDSILDEVSRPT